MSSAGILIQSAWTAFGAEGRGVELAHGADKA